ncbi:MAG: aminopeptidase P family protein [Acidobacteria bacterium]|nr:aminopeptidase P family protein [Acidobacteriota bacterium]
MTTETRGLAPPSRLADRLDAVRAALAADGLDGLVVSHLPHLYYLLNLRASAGLAIVGTDPGDLTLIVDFRYAEAVDRLQSAGFMPPGLDVVPVPADGTYDGTLASHLRASGSRCRVGIESDHYSVRRWSWLTRALGGSVELVPSADLVERARMVKDTHEIALFRAAGHMLADAVAPATAAARAGRTELEVAREIDAVLQATGFEALAFETIVATGPNGALPHAHPGERRIEEGDLVLLDFGGVHHRYCVDLSRTVAVGTIPDEARRLHDAVAEAQAAAIAAAVPGVRASEVDAAARAALERHDLADAFGHSTGHGLGIEVHELPRIGRPRVSGEGETDDAVLAPGMVFTIEPGVYVPGFGGVRIEDDVLMTEDGPEVLTTPTDLHTTR